MALPGLIRVSTVARILGVDRRTALAALTALGASPVRRPQERSTVRSGVAYCTFEQAVDLVDNLLPRVVHRLANRRAREAMAKEAKLTARSGECVRYRNAAEGGGTPSEAPRPKPPLLPLQPKFPTQSPNT